MGFFSFLNHPFLGVSQFFWKHPYLFDHICGYMCINKRIILSICMYIWKTYHWKSDHMDETNCIHFPLLATGGPLLSGGKKNTTGTILKFNNERKYTCPRNLWMATHGYTYHSSFNSRTSVSLMWLTTIYTCFRLPGKQNICTERCFTKVEAFQRYQWYLQLRHFLRCRVEAFAEV